MTQATFAERISHWQRDHGRHHLPWQVSDPYRIWLSEVMLQQTQVSTVLDYFPRFIARFPDVASLAAAPLDDVLALWSGLGYYSRARNLHHSAQQVVNDYAGTFPRERVALESLKGVGRSTAAAIAVFAFGAREAILDGNVKRILTRHEGIEGVSSNAATLKQLWASAEARLPADDALLKPYTQGLMDLGSLVCTRSRPDCAVCPVRSDCYAYLNDCTETLPSKKPRKALPKKHTVMLLAHSKRGIHLNRRPDHGIWRNLWSFPEFADLDTAHTFARSLGKTDQQKTLTPFTHRFTHYQLHIQPLVVRINAPNTEQNWLPVEYALAKGLPKPIRQLIEETFPND
ncbi:A/G-specific adenine glycosylase [Suttonella sp. R2A3]|uniref:A/G-specific adenine glycosylase n=1 Tax=Suttonella sp. R2A3 TaxID=2908648 RepID=UPI001F372D82|nr:A/G-specific adenine glycosylase [Suttonella sp. R2A3]UJF23724.1 A/G-specific adenine glycosylase [Suttonella sp. R2A3]